jgi:hypothetical protein
MKIDISWNSLIQNIMFPVHDTLATDGSLLEWTDFAYQNWIDTLQKSFAESNSKKGSVFHTPSLLKVYVLLWFNKRNH